MKTLSPGALGVVAALMSGEIKVRRTDPSRTSRYTVLTKSQVEYLDEKRKLAAELRRERRKLKRANLLPVPQASDLD